jgi:hypothetical protein
MKSSSSQRCFITGIPLGLRVGATRSILLIAVDDCTEARARHAHAFNCDRRHGLRCAVGTLIAVHCAGLVRVGGVHCHALRARRIARNSARFTQRTVGARGVGVTAPPVQWITTGIFGSGQRCAHEALAAVIIVTNATCARGSDIARAYGERLFLCLLLRRPLALFFALGGLFRRSRRSLFVLG